MNFFLWIVAFFGSTVSAFSVTKTEEEDDARELTSEKVASADNAAPDTDSAMPDMGHAHAQATADTNGTSHAAMKVDHSHGTHPSHKAADTSHSHSHTMSHDVRKVVKIDNSDPHDMHAHMKIDLPPPGKDASAQEVSDYLDALFAQGETHVHGAHSDLANEHTAAMDLVPRAESDAVAIESGDWFDPTIWANGKVPVDGDNVLIPEGVTVDYGTVSDIELFAVRVDGKLSFATDSDSQMIFDTMVVTPSGELEIGTVDNPVQANVDVDLIIANNGPIDVEWDPMLLSRGIISHGKASIHGAEKDSHEKVVDDPMQGDTSVTFADAPEGWTVGDTIVVAGTRHDGWKWDNKAADQAFYDSQDEERVISKIDGNTVHFDKPLEFDHDTPREDLKTSVANYTRNVSVETEDADSAEIAERGHVMFMHSDKVDVRYAEFHQLGRTDKSELSFQADDFAQIESDSNVQGRYSLHLHRTGVEDLENPTFLIGNAVYGSPGWGFVHHDSNAILENNASFDTFGAGYVAETGNETGAWNDNIAILAQGNSWGTSKNQSLISDDQFDTARSGDGFWFQGRLVGSSDNVAASVNTGFVYFHRDGDDRMINANSEHFVHSDALQGGFVTADDIPISMFDGNETFAARAGFHVAKANPNQGHDVWSHLKDFTAWSVKQGAVVEYTSHYILEGFDVIGKEPTLFSDPEQGINIGNNTTEVVIIDAKISGFKTGIDLEKNLINIVGDDSIHGYVVVNADISDVDQNYSNYDPRYDQIFSKGDVTHKTPDLQLDGPLEYVYDPGNGNNRFVEISGTKTDSIGQAKFPGGSDDFNLGEQDVIRLLETDGYWTTNDGDKYLLLDIYTTDRATGDIYYETHPVFLNTDFPLGTRGYSDAIDRGVQDFEESHGKTYAGDRVLDVAQPASPFAHLVNSDTPQDIMSFLSNGHETLDETMSGMDDMHGHESETMFDSMLA